MGYGEWETDFEGGIEAGDIYYVAGGTYTLTSNFDAAASGSAVAPIKVIGVAAGTTNEPPVYSDWASTTDRPLVACGGYYFYHYYSDNYTNLYNLRFTGTSDYIVGIGTGAMGYNLKAHNSFGTADRAAFRSDSANHLLSSEGQSDNGRAFYQVYSYAHIISCYFHDSAMGIIYADRGCSVINSIIDTCPTYGIYMGGTYGIVVVGNTIYNCGIGVHGTTTYGISVTNNIIDACTTGASWDTATDANFWDYNCWDNATDTSNVTWGAHRVEGDPGLTDPGNGDFTLGSGSNCLGVGMQVGTNTGATGDYKVNIGADQDDVTAAGGAAANGAMMGVF